MLLTSTGVKHMWEWDDGEVLKVCILPNLLCNYKCTCLVWLKYLSAGTSSLFLHWANDPSVKLLAANRDKSLTSNLQVFVKTEEIKPRKCHGKLPRREIFQLFFFASVLCSPVLKNSNTLIKSIGYILSFMPLVRYWQWVLKRNVWCGTAETSASPRQSVHSLDSQFGLPAPTCRITFPGQFHPVREDKKKHVADMHIQKAVIPCTYQYKACWSCPHVSYVEIFCQIQQFPKDVEESKMNLSSYQNGGNNSWLLFNPVKIPAVLPQEYRAIEVGKF